MEKIKAYLTKDLDGWLSIWKHEPAFNRKKGRFSSKDPSNPQSFIIWCDDNLVEKGQCVEITITKGKTTYDYKNTPEGKLMNAIFGGKKV